MSSTDYSYFNKNNYHSFFPDLPKSGIDFKRLPLYSVNGTQVITYFLIAATAITLGYVTLKEDGSEKKEEEPIKENPKTEGGKNNTKKRKHNTKNKSNHKK